MDIGEILLPSKDRAGDSWEWATVTQASPLQIRLDGETAPLTESPVDTVGGLVVSDRVLCLYHGKQFIVMARVV